MTVVARFTNGFKASPTRRTRGTVSHGWHAVGRLKGGDTWSMHGFSIGGAKGAAAQMYSDTRHIPRSGGTIEFSEVVAVEIVGELVPA
jgi:hypothetical protein